MSDQKPLVSTVDPAVAPAAESLEASAKVGVDDGKLLLSDVQASLKFLLQQLASNSVISETDPLKQFMTASEPINDFIATLQADITKAKSATPQGLQLSQQLLAGSITQAQFKSAIDGIVLSAATLEAAVAVDLPQATQKLILAIANETELKKLSQLVTNSNTKPAALPPKLAHNNPDVPTVAAPLIVSVFADEKLSFLQNLFKVAESIALQNLKASASSLLSLKPAPRIMTGARAVVKLNGKVAALCTSVSYEISSDWTEIRGIDELIPNDLAPSSFSVKGTMSIYRVPNKSPIGDFLQQDMFRGIIWPYSTIEIRDKRTDELIMLVKRAAITSRSESFQKGTATTTNLSFVGIGFRDEIAPELLPDVLTGSSDGTGGLLDTFNAISNKVKDLF